MRAFLFPPSRGYLWSGVSGEPNGLMCTRSAARYRLSFQVDTDSVDDCVNRRETAVEEGNTTRAHRVGTKGSCTYAA